MSNEFRVTFEPSGRGVYVLPGTLLLEAAARAGFILETPCGGAGKCGKCLVRITAGAAEGCGDEQHALPREQFDAGYRLACQCRLSGEVVVEIPESSLFQSGQQILTHAAGETVEVCPAVVKRHLRLDTPERETVLSDAERLSLALETSDMDIDVLRDLPRALRAGDEGITATLVDGRVVRVEPGNRAGHCYGVAFDIGTTTLVCTLVELAAGRDLAIASRVNPQTSYGDDVISRIRKCREEAGGLAELHGAILEAVGELIGDVAAQTGIRPADICGAVFAGNTTMQQILCGIDPSALGELPFVPAFREPLSLRASELGIGIMPSAMVHVLPQIGGFVGGDTVAGILATRLDEEQTPTLLVDVGTNGELVLANRGRLVATSVAAGPAFEGARITHGMRATGGAIEKVVLDGDVEINVIGNAAPRGLCGTGLIDAVAALLRTGILDSTGRILAPEELPAALPDALRRRVVPNNGEFRFDLVQADASGTGEPVSLFQRDIRELQLANGAIRAGIAILLQMEELTPDDLGCVLLAGAFGNFIRRGNARRIGMLPAIPTSRIRFVGNTASFGARQILLSTAEQARAARIVHQVRHVDLSMRPEFQMEFGAAMLFPEE